MTDADESQASGSDYANAQEPICSQQKEPYKVHACETNTQMKHSHSRQKKAAPEESSDELNGVCRPSAEVLLDSSDSEIDLSAAGGSEYHPKSSIAPSKQKKRSLSPGQQAGSVEGVPDSESSSDSSVSHPSPLKSLETSKQQKSKLNLKAIFAYHFRGKKFKAAAHRKFKVVSGKRRKKRKYESTGKPVGRPPLTASPLEQKRRLLDRGFRFPFVEKHYGKKDLPLKMVLGYEQAATKGYLQYIEVLKYEEHLRKALKALEADEDLERECLVVRKHKYLDDEGPISPIQEASDDGDDSLNSHNQDDFDAKVVENSSFIISSKIPSKKKSKQERKRAKSPKVIEVEEEEDCAAANSGLLQGSPQ
ncbi:TATA box-binding protein-associated factor RNA polymerase I subunit D [Caloenas nicobarica]|uniref:TATA box-binding protein-associated factor RNA polymerase I subunit D n=1 Tax=Caloenas nicobarica TaxID=187106 RepID=UPI0032B71055